MYVLQNKQSKGFGAMCMFAACRRRYRVLERDIALANLD